MAEATGTVENVIGTPPAQATTSSAPDWFESLPAEYKVDPHVVPFKGKPVSEVLRSHIEAQKMVSGSIRLPKPDATPEEKAKFYEDIYTKMGRPESPEKYGRFTPTTLPNGVPWNEAQAKKFAAMAHKRGLTSDQFGGVLDDFASLVGESAATLEQERAETERVLRAEWGGDFERREQIASRAAYEVGGQEYAKLLEAKGIAHHPLVLRAHAAFGEVLVEQKLISGDQSGATAATDAQTRIQAIVNDKNHPYHKGDQAAAEEMLRLRRAAMGKEGAKIVATFG